MGKPRHGGKREGAGRKPKGATTADRVIKFRVAAADLIRYTTFAARQNLTLSAALREAYETAIARGSTR